MFKKLAGKMLIIYIPSMFILLVTMMAATLWVTSSAIQALMLEQYQQKTQQFTALINAGLTNRQQTANSPDDLQNYLSGIYSGDLQNGYVFIMTPDGSLLASAGLQKINNSSVFTFVDVSFKPLLENWINQQIGSGGGHLQNIPDLNNNQSSVWFTAPLNNGSLLVLSLPQSVMTKDSMPVGQTFLWIGLAALLIFSIIVSFSITKFMQPLNLLVKNANHIVDGRLDEEIFVKSQDEIGQVAEALRQISKRVKSLAEAAHRVANGELNFSMEIKSEQDALGQDFNLMIQKLQSLINELKNETERLQDSSETLALSSRQTGDAAAQISTTIQQVSQGVLSSTDSISRTASSIDEMSRSIESIARGADEQASAVNQASQVTVKLSEVIQRVNGNASVVVSEASRAGEVARAGSEKVRETVKGMENIQTTVGLSAQKVREMGTRSEQITSIIEALDTIASQTNLLALNAAIEAARAGVHGKGFAVVADEVRKLADRASNSSHEIAEIIESINVSVSEAVNTMDNGAKEVENGVNRAHEAGQALSDIMEAVEAVIKRASGTVNATETMRKLSAELVAAMDSVSSVVDQNNQATAQMSSDSNLVSQSIENIASIAEQNSAAVEQVGATAEQLSGEAGELAKAADNLSTMTVNVTGLISRFKV
ncbi:MAG: methyl-accepting chemotaxis protein [Anaerolineae bacterium]|nr:methyl-accepting chemotaxis protein [Anaerolineae bacterium]